MRSRIPPNLASPIVLAILLIVGLGVTLPAARESLNTSKPYQLYSGASAWLEENTPSGTRIFQTDWDDFPRLFYYNTHNTYLVGLDPTYMQLYDAGLYDLWVDITQGKIQNPSAPILSEFGASYIMTDLQHEAFIRRAGQDPALEEAYRDGDAIIFKVLTP